MEDQSVGSWKHFKMKMILRIIVFHTFRDNININDVLGDYSLTLVESLGTLAVSLIFFFSSNKIKGHFFL